MFKITTDPTLKLVCIELQGMLSADEVAEIYRQEHLAIRAMHCQLGEHIVLLDVRQCPIQFQEVVAAFQQGLTSHNAARLLAIVTGSSLARMQIRRVVNHGRMAMFNTVEEAEAWLFSQPEPMAESAVA